jgi:hypothetical protein|tara:strand:+ start:5762 stop:6211 length:450 start_codon:yes stop_codon:yes gene_type:complete
MERVIDCPVCFDVDHCFEEIQKEFSSFLCFKCGFMSDSRYETESLRLIENLKSSPKLVQDLKFLDKKRNITWFPAVINMGTLGIIFPEGTKKNWGWRYAKVIDIPEEEQSKYDNYSQRLDVENAKKFGQYEFIEACKKMGITRDIKPDA